MSQALLLRTALLFVLFGSCFGFEKNLNGQQIELSDTQIIVEFVIPESALTDSCLVAISAEWSEGQFGLMLRLGDPILDKAGNTAPTGTSIPTGPTYDPTTGPHKPPKHWEPIDCTTIPVFRGGTTFDAGTDLNIDPTTGNVIPNDQDPNNPKKPRGPSVNTDPSVPVVVNDPNIIIWMPEDLEVVQQGGGRPGDETANPPKPPTTHGVIQPKIPMSKATFEELLDRIITKPYTPPGSGGSGGTGSGTGGVAGG